MKVKNSGGPSKMESRKNQYFTFYVIAVVIIIAAVFLYFIWNKHSFSEQETATSTLENVLAEDISVPDQHPVEKTVSTSQPSSQPPIVPVEIESPVVPQPLPEESITSQPESNDLSEPAGNETVVEASSPEDMPQSATVSSLNEQSSLICKECSQYYYRFLYSS